MDTDVLIVGGGPAGLAAAIAIRQKGLGVTLIDSRTPPIDKACGEGLLPEATSALRDLGIELDRASAAPFAGIRFSDGNFSAAARFSRGMAFGLRRTALHRLLVDRASEAGVPVLWGTRISALHSAGAWVNGRLIRYRWLIGADGRHSAVRRFAKIGSTRGRSRFGFRRHYAVAPWTDLVEVHWGQRCQVVLTPTGEREICVSLFTADAHRRLDRALSQFPGIARRLCDARPVSAEAGAVTSLAGARAVTRGNVALVGDASCTVDGVAGQGLSLAFRQALALADALARGNLALYQSAHQRIVRTATRMTRLLLLMNSSATIRRKALRLFATRPALFAKMIAVHAGETPSGSLRAAGILSLGWRVLCA
jgi:menaquinone-9 beta-reductase